MQPTSTGINRRTFLAGIATAAVTSILAACGGSSTSTDTPAAATKASGAAGAPTSASTTAPVIPGGIATTGSASTSAGNAPPQVKLKAVKLRIAQFGPADTAQATQKVMEGFKQIQPDVTVEVFPVQTPDWDGYAAKLLTQIAGGDTPDIIYLATEGLQLFAAKGITTSLDEYVMRDKEQLKEFFADVHPSLVESMMYDGHLYSLPEYFNCNNIIYSKGAFDKRGIPYPTEEWTQDDFANLMPKLTTQSGGKTTEYAFFWTNRLWAGALSWIFINGSNILSEEKFAGGDALWSTFYPNDPAAKGRQGGTKWANATANVPANIEAVQFLADLTQKLKAAPTPVEADAFQAQVTTTFANKQLAMYLSGGNGARTLNAAGVKPDEYGITFMPKWKSRRHHQGTLGYAMAAKSPNKDAAFELLKWRVQKETMSSNFKVTSSTRSRRSINQALYEGAYGIKGWKIFYDTIDKYPDTAPIPQPPQANQVQQIFTKYIGLAVTGDQPVQTAMDSMQKELTDALAKPA